MVRFLAVLSMLCAAAAAQQTARQDTVDLRAGELTLLIGNEADHGADRTGYIGIWSLTSIHQPANVFVPKYAGWILHRNRATVTRVSASEAAIRHLDSGGAPHKR